MERYDDLGADPDLAEALRPQSVQTGLESDQPNPQASSVAPFADPFAWLHDNAIGVGTEANGATNSNPNDHNDAEIEDTFEWLESLDLADDEK